MNKIIKVFILCVVSFSFSMNGMSQQFLKQIIDRGELRVGMTGTQPPFTMKDTTGKFMGYEVELAQMLAKAMQVKLNIVEIPFAELISSLHEGKIDMIMSGMTMTIKRNMQTIFIGPHMISGKSILTRSLALAATDEPEDLNSDVIKIAVLKGSTSEDFVNKEIPEAQLTLCKDYNECIQLLESGKVNIVVADYPVCAYTTQIHPEKGLITNNQPLTVEPIGVALPPDAAHFINLVENFLNSLLLTGALDEMQTYWFESGDWVDKVKVN